MDSHEDVNHLEERGILTTQRPPQRPGGEGGEGGGDPLPRRGRRHALPRLADDGEVEDDDVDEEAAQEAGLHGDVLIAELVGPGRWGQAAFPQWFIDNFFQVLPGTGDTLRLLPVTQANGLESVREVYVFKHSFLSMRRIDAKSRKARAVLVRFSKSLASRRHLPSQANVLSTTHRLGMTSKPTAVSDRLTISVSKWGKIFFRAWSNTGPWYPPSAKSFFRNGNLPNKVPRTRTPPSRSWILAGCTMACTNRPTVSTRMWRFLPLIFLPAS